MANNEIGMSTLNKSNRLEALKVLEKLKSKERSMKSKVTTAVENGRLTIREHFKNDDE